MVARLDELIDQARTERFLKQKAVREANGLQHQAENFISAEPFKALLIAGAAGAVLAWMFTRR